MNVFFDDSQTLYSSYTTWHYAGKQLTAEMIMKKYYRVLHKEPTKWMMITLIKI